MKSYIFFLSLLVFISSPMTFGQTNHDLDNTCVPSHVEGSSICVGDSVAYRLSDDKEYRGGNTFVGAKYGLIVETVKHILPGGYVQLDDGSKPGMITKFFGAPSPISEHLSTSVTKVTDGCYEDICAGKTVESAFSPFGALWDNLKHERATFETHVYGLTPDNHFIIQQKGSIYYVTAEEVGYGQGDPAMDRYREAAVANAIAHPDPVAIPDASGRVELKAR